LPLEFSLRRYPMLMRRAKNLAMRIMKVTLLEAVTAVVAA